MKNERQKVEIYARVSIQRFLFFISFFCLTFLFAPPVASQTISGTVSDQNNAPIENAKVVLRNRTQIVSETLTAADGKFALDLKNSQSPIISIEASGFADFSRVISPKFTEYLNVRLEPETLRSDVTISITRTETRLSETPASVVVLSRETLETTAAQNIDDKLRQIAGFTLFRRASSKTSNPTTQGANLRGLAGSGASRASVLLDGLSVNDAFGSWTYWSRIPTIAVEQVEVLRGGASAFYGDQGLSGAVNLRTKSYDSSPILRFQTSTGTQKTFDGSLFTAYGINGWNFDLVLDGFQTSGYIPTVKDERGIVDARADSRHRNGFLTIEKRLTDASGSSADSRQNDARIFLKTNIFSERRNNGTILTNNRTYFLQASAGADFSNQMWGWFQLRTFFDKQIYDQNFSAISNNRNTETLSRIQRVPSQAFGANLLWSRSIGAKHAVSASVEFRNVKGFSDEIIFANSRASSIVGAGGNQQTFSVFTQDIWRASSKLNISIGGRFDIWENSNALSTTRSLASNQMSVSIFPNRRENAFSPRVAALYQINQNLSVIASYAKSFRAPTLNELYRAFRVGNVLTLANENLNSERADTFESGLNFTGFKRILNVRGNFFVAQVSQPVVSITLTSAPALITRRRQNVGKTRARGIELDAEFRLNAKWNFSTSYLLTDARVKEFSTNPVLVDKFLPQVARQQMTFQIAYRPTDRLTFSTQGRISDRQFEDDLNTLRLRSYATFDAFASYKITKNLGVFVAAENIFNSRYDIGLTPNRTVAAPAFIRLGLRFDLSGK